MGGGLTVAKAAKLLPGRGDGGPSPATVWRYATRGLAGPDGRRVKLEMVRVGGANYPSREAVARFVAALQAPPEPDDTQADEVRPAASPARLCELEAVEVGLAARGL